MVPTDPLGFQEKTSPASIECSAARGPQKTLLEESSFFFGEVKNLMVKCQPKTLFTGKWKESCSLSFRLLFFRLVYFFICFPKRKTVAEQTPWCYMTGLHITYCTFDSMNNRLLPHAMLLLHSKLLLVLSIYSVLSFSHFITFLLCLLS